MIQEKLASDRVWEYCIVGTGPVGMALAMEIEQLGQQVLLVESGGREVDAATADASRALIADPARHARMEDAVCRALGGTSWTWGGRAVPFDEVDWMRRDFVPWSDWPIGHEELRSWYAQASKYLTCGDQYFYSTRPLSGGLTTEWVERWCKDSRVILAHRERLLASSRIHISLNTTVTALQLDAAGGAIESLTVQTPDGPAAIRARQFVLAMGGVETTRLLLAAQQSYPAQFGGAGGPLGRYYMGHISGKIANIVFDDPASIDEFDFVLDESGAFHRRRFMLTAECQVENRLLNTAFWPDNPKFYDPAHRNGVLSAVFLALAFPPTGRFLLPEAIRVAHTGPRPYELGAHLRNAILGAPAGALDVYRILRDRFIRKPRKPGFLLKNRGGAYALHYHAEQVPNPESRITLTGELDRFGLPRAAVDLRFIDQDVDSVVRSHRVLDTLLRQNRIGRLEFHYPESALAEQVYAQASDGVHQAGTTRLGADPATSVVDPRLKVHGLDNLYVASSSVFVTTGQANSTLPAVAFAVRLAHHLVETIAPNLAAVTAEMTDAL